jgi:hypothetical protein
MSSDHLRNALALACRKFPLKKAILYFLALAIPFALERAPDILRLQPGGTGNTLTSTVFLYQWIVTVGPRKPRAHFVQLIMIDPDTEPDELTDPNSPCQQRDFMARLLRVVAEANPAVIVVDKFFGVSCTAEQTAQLLAAFRDVSNQVPVVLARFDQSPMLLPGRSEAKLHILENKGAVVAFPTLAIDANVKYGLQTLNADDRKIPLQWPVLPKDVFDGPVSALAGSVPAVEPTLASRRSGKGV